MSKASGLSLLYNFGWRLTLLLAGPSVSYVSYWSWARLQQLGAAELQLKQQELLEQQHALQQQELKQEMKQLEGEIKYRSLHSITDLIAGIIAPQSAGSHQLASASPGVHRQLRPAEAPQDFPPVTHAAQAQMLAHPSAAAPTWVHLLSGLEDHSMQPSIATGLAGSLVLALGGRARRR